VKNNEKWSRKTYDIYALWIPKTCHRGQEVHSCELINKLTTHTENQCFASVFTEYGSSTLLNPDPDPACCLIWIRSGSSDQYLLWKKVNKIYYWKFFLIKNRHTWHVLLNPYNVIQTLQTWNFFVLFWGPILTCLDRDRESGSADPIEYGSGSETLQKNPCIQIAQSWKFLCKKC